jgi:DNA invertase Pin-like site-specific DNA recombinase
MNILYTRISTIEQKNNRQVQNAKEFDYVIEDKCSGATPFFERDGGKRIKKMIAKSQITKVTVHQIDRLGRNLLDINFIQQGIKTLNDDGTENPISKMIISVLGVVAEMERNLIRERQAEGIAIAKANGVYKGRVFGTKESNLDFLNKPKVKLAIEFLNRGKKSVEVQKLTLLHRNTITKIKKLNQLLNNEKYIQIRANTL